MTGNPPIKPYSHKEIGEIYGMSEKVMHNWLRPFKELVGRRIGRYYTVVQVRTIFSCLGLPE